MKSEKYLPAHLVLAVINQFSEADPFKVTFRKVDGALRTMYARRQTLDDLEFESPIPVMDLENSSFRSFRANKVLGIQTNEFFLSAKQRLS